MTESKGRSVATMLDEAPSLSDEDEKLAHLVLKLDWPIAPEDRELARARTAGLEFTAVNVKRALENADGVTSE